MPSHHRRDTHHASGTRASQGIPPRPEHPEIVTSFDDIILEDASIGCVVEVIGGVTAARDIVLRALKAGKHVVTANKVGGR